MNLFSAVVRPVSLVLFALALPTLAATPDPAAPDPGGPARSTAASPAVVASAAPDPVAWLDGPELVEASTCTATTKCFSGGEILSCSGTFCGQRTGCYVFCNTTGLVECPPSRFCP